MRLAAQNAASRSAELYIIMQTLNTSERIILDLELAIDDITVAAGKMVPGSFAQVQLHKSAERVSIVIAILKMNPEAVI